MAGTIFSINQPNPETMDLFIIILAFLLAYGIFVVIAVKLAKMFFPQANEDEVELNNGTIREGEPKRFTV